jgi:F-type H+-transporting ATPase subunit a
MALIVIIWAHFEAFRARGFRGYFKHYTQPYAALTPINFVEEITKPITLTFRLFGNLFSGGLMIVVVAALAPIALGPFEIIWKPFDLFIGLIQAFIFMLLTIMYFGMAMSHDDEHDIEHGPHDTALLETSQ